MNKDILPSSCVSWSSLLWIPTCRCPLLYSHKPLCPTRILQISQLSCLVPREGDGLHGIFSTFFAMVTYYPLFFFSFSKYPFIIIVIIITVMLSI